MCRNSPSNCWLNYCDVVDCIGIRLCSFHWFIGTYYAYFEIFKACSFAFRDIWKSSNSLYICICDCRQPDSTCLCYSTLLKWQENIRSRIDLSLNKQKDENFSHAILFFSEKQLEHVPVNNNAKLCIYLRRQMLDRMCC